VVEIEVSHGYEERVEAGDREADRRVERARSVAKQNREIMPVGVRDGDISFAIEVEVTGGYRNRCCTGWEIRCCGKASGAVTEQNRNAVRVGVRDCDVRLGVKIEVSHCDEARYVPRRETSRCTKVAFAVA